MKLLGLAALLVVSTACSAPREDSRESARPETATATSVPATATTAQHSACATAPNRLCPHDEGETDPSFLAFREQLTDAVARKDAGKLLALVDPKIRTTFGEGGGPGDLEKAWKPSDPNSAIWGELETILALGGSFQGAGADRSFWAPYVYANWPESVDAFSHVAAIRDGVVLRTAPASDAPVLATVAWEILELIPEPHDSKEWRHVRIGKGEAWVHAADVRSPIGYRAGFTKRSGAWKMDALVAGD